LRLRSFQPSANRPMAISDPPAAESVPRPPSRARLALGYSVMLLAAVGLFLLIRSYGETLTASPAAHAATPARGDAAPGDALLHVLLALATVIVLGRLVGQFLVYLGQPPVIGEVIAGIMLGPSLLGHWAPSAAHYLLPPAVAPYLGVIAQFGVILYMFL